MKREHLFKAFVLDGQVLVGHRQRPILSQGDLAARFELAVARVHGLVPYCVDLSVFGEQLGLEVVDGLLERIDHAPGCAHVRQRSNVAGLCVRVGVVGEELFDRLFLDPTALCRAAVLHIDNVELFFQLLDLFPRIRQLVAQFASVEGVTGRDFPCLHPPGPQAETAHHLFKRTASHPPRSRGYPWGCGRRARPGLGELQISFSALVENRKRLGKIEEGLLDAAITPISSFRLGLHCLWRESPSV